MIVNKVVPAPETWEKPPEGFGPGEPVRLDDRWVAADLRPDVLEFRRPLRLVRPGLLAMGFERSRRFASALPPGLRLDALWISQNMGAGATCALGLAAGEPRQVPRGAGMLNTLTDPLPSLYDVSGGMGGIPPEGEGPLPWFNKRELVEGEDLWAMVEGLLAAGFTAADLDTFAGSPLVGVALHLAATEVVEAYQGRLLAREADALMRALVGNLKGWTKADLAGPYSREVFAESVQSALALASASALPALVHKLAPRTSAQHEGGVSG